MTPRNKLKNIVLAVAAASMAAPLVAHAQTETVLIRDGMDAGLYRMDEDGRDRPGEDYYPGSEQSKAVQFSNGKVGIFGMSSYRLNGELPRHRVQGFCAIVSITQDGPQVEMIKHISNNRGNRYRNFHHVGVQTIFGGEAALVFHNYAEGNRARQYAQVFDSNCEPVSNEELIIAKNNDDCSESGENPTDTYNESENSVEVVVAAGCNGNGEDDAWVAFASVDKDGDGTYTVDRITDRRMSNREERHRADCHTLDDDTVVCCGTEGNTQPPNRGVYCRAYDTDSKDTLWKQYVERPENGTLPTQIKMSCISPDTCVANYTQITGQRRRGKGMAQSMDVTLKFSRDGMDILHVPQPGLNLASDATHSSTCVTQFGVDGSEQPRVIKMSGTMNGSPEGQLTGVALGYNTTNRQLFIEGNRKIGMRAAADAGWLPNKYGGNPNTQGRNFLRCTGDVANPNYGITGAWRSDVKSFFMVPANSRRRQPNGLPEEKLALELVLVPAVVAPDTPDQPQNDPPPPPQNDDPQQGDDPAPTPNPGNDDQPSGGDGSAPPTSAPTSNLGGCAVSAQTNGAGFAALLGLALVALRRRRRR